MKKIENGEGRVESGEWRVENYSSWIFI